MMSFKKSTVLLVVFFMSLAILSQVKVEAARVLPNNFATTNHLETYSSVYEKAKSSMACWLQHLAGTSI